MWAATTVKRPPHNNQHNPQYANYWAPLTRKRHIPPQPAQPRHTNHWAPRTRKRHQQEHRPQRPTERSDPTQHAKGRPGDRPGPRKGTTTRRSVTQGGGGGFRARAPPPPEISQDPKMPQCPPPPPHTIYSCRLGTQLQDTRTQLEEDQVAAEPQQRTLSEGVASSKPPGF